MRWTADGFFPFAQFTVIQSPRGIERTRVPEKTKSRAGLGVTQALRPILEINRHKSGNLLALAIFIRQTIEVLLSYVLFDCCSTLEDAAVTNDWGREDFAELVLGQFYEAAGFGLKHKCFATFVGCINSVANQYRRRKKFLRSLQCRFLGIVNASFDFAFVTWCGGLSWQQRESYQTGSITAHFALSIFRRVPVWSLHGRTAPKST